MEQKNLSKWLKFVIIGVGICGLVIYAFIVPMCGSDLRASYPEFSDHFWPWAFFIWVSGIPCYMVLVFAWKISSNIGNDRSFTEQNAGYLKLISVIAAGDTVFFFAGNIVMLLFDMSHPSIVIASLFVDFIGVAISIAAAALSHLVKKAAALQEQSDLTI